MRKIKFITELKSELSPADFLFLRTLYGPVVGWKAIALFSLIYDYSLLQKKYQNYDDFADLARTLNFTISEACLERQKLEAVGLLRIFAHADDNHHIFTINKPLAPNEFQRNSLLFKSSIAKIGELIFEKMIFFDLQKSLAKDDFRDITAKYQDLFSFNREDNHLIERQTLSPKIYQQQNTIDQAITSLKPAQFIDFLINHALSPSQKGMIDKVTNWGFSSYATNLLINYSYQTNNKQIISAHIIKIAKDFKNKKLVHARQIKSELEKALQYKQKAAISPIFHKPKDKHFDLEIDQEESWDDLLEAMGGLNG